MATVLPKTELEQIEFCEAHIAGWTANAVAIGLTAGQCTSLASDTTKARGSYNAALLARIASKAATGVSHNDAKTMRLNAANLVLLIKTKAETTNNPSIYTTAQIPPPAPASPKPPPSQPTDISVGLESDGSLTLRWKSKGATPSSGVFFQVQRKLAGEPMFTNIGGAPNKEFNDATVPSGVAQVVYIITGFRGTRAGEPSEQVAVQFGIGGQGLTVSGASLKMAA